MRRNHGRPVVRVLLPQHMHRFAEEAGKVLSSDELLRRVWGPDVFLTDRVVYTHVNNLRGKLEGESWRLVSVRGLGYRFDP